MYETFPLGTKVRVSLLGAKYLAKVTGYHGRTKLHLALLVRRPGFGQNLTVNASEVEKVTVLPMATLGS